MNFSDASDEATAREQMMIDVGVANARKMPTAIFTGKCGWCAETITQGCYCDSDCRDDHQSNLRAISQRALA